ncbi:MAG: aminotransferase class IV [Nitrospinales bacterium]
MEPIVYLNGKFVALKNARVSILDRGFTHGDGLFETMRAYGGRVFRLDLHLQRLFRSAKSIYLPIPLTQAELASAIEKTIRKNRCPEAYVRLTVTRGNHRPGLSINSSVPATVVVYAQPLTPTPRKLYRRGVSIALFPATATRTGGLQTQVKSCNYLSQILIREMAARQNAYEGILLDGKNRITEGAACNIFVVRDGVIKTPRISPSILPGITRRTVLDIAREQRLPCFERILKRDDVYRADEVFLTNSMIEILPVTQADGRHLGNGKPGAITRRLHAAYLKMIEQP